MDDHNDSSLPSGHTTTDSLRILHDELSSVIRQHQISLNHRSISRKIKDSFLYHRNHTSVLHWTNGLILFVLALLSVIGYGLQIHKNGWLIVQSFVLICLLVINAVIVQWTWNLRQQEIVTKAKNVLNKIIGMGKNSFMSKHACSHKNNWTLDHYIPLHSPLSPCVSLQWTRRDGQMINLPAGLIVEGDILMLRPGQTVIAKCRPMKMGYSAQDSKQSECDVLQAGCTYNPLPAQNQNTSDEPRITAPVGSVCYIALETPFVKNLINMLVDGHSRPVSVLDNERHQIYNVWIEKRCMPVLLLLTFVINLLRYLLLDSSGHWSEMCIIFPVQVLVPLCALWLPVLWTLIDMFGVARFLTVYHHSKLTNLSIGLENFGSEKSLESEQIDTSWSWQSAFQQFREVITGQSPCLARTANIVHAFGNVTSFCCIDKKGILSWPNPTAEKVFFMRTGSRSSTESDHDSYDSDADSGSEHPPSVDENTANNTCPHKDYAMDTTFEVLNVSQNPKDGHGLLFDDKNWQNYSTSLKPLGLNILLNTCNMHTVSQYTEFADHVTCASLRRERAIPVVNRRCFCELSRQIGFSSNAADIFQKQQTLGMYRNIPKEPLDLNDSLIPSKSFIKYKMPMPNVFSVIVKDTTGSQQLMSQGTADLISDSCSEFWDGYDLCVLGERERKKIADFYQRTSMSSYCTAFSYRPLSNYSATEYNDVYIEIPEGFEESFHFLRSPSPTRLWDINSEQRMPGINSHTSDMYYHGSVDSLMRSSSMLSMHNSQSCFTNQCNQIFIGMITMQYQAKQDIVKMIDDLELACIRFVHFSKENELRSRVFAEKMGLEAGWNCHISLLDVKKVLSTVIPGDNNETATEDTADKYESPAKNNTSNNSHYSHEALQQVKSNPMQNESQLKLKTSAKAQLADSQGKWLSAPGAINVMVSQVKFDSSGTNQQKRELKNEPRDEGEGSQLFDMTNSEGSSLKSEDDQVDKKSTVSSISAEEPLLHKHDNVCAEYPGTYPEVCGVYHADDTVVSSEDVDDEFRHTHGNGGYSGGNREGAENMSSTVTDNTDSVTYQWSNRAKLPRGIDTIRNHIECVDNVPLLVSLFTDCTPATTKEMIEILQENEEVVCCLGSSANIENTSVLLQANCSMSVEPLYPQLCVSSPVLYNSWDTSNITPMQLNAALHSLPCSLSVQRDDTVIIVQLIAQARYHCEVFRNCMLLLLMMQMTISILLTVNQIILAPPTLTISSSLWLVTIITPAIAITTLGNPLDVSIMKDAQGKNVTSLSTKLILQFVLYYGARFVPSVIVCLVCHVLTLSSFCHTITKHTNDTCHIIYGNIDHHESHTFNGWTTEYAGALNISQNITAMQIALYFVIIGVSYMNRHIQLWKKLPFSNRLWCVITPSVLLLQLIYCISDISVHSYISPASVHITDVPLATWILACLWPFILLPYLELVKHQENRLSIRYQKRARLDFGTKLGMNSPF